MSKLEVIRELYNQVKALDVGDIVEIESATEEDEMTDFVAMISDFVLQKKMEEDIL